MRHLVFVTLYRWLSGMQGGTPCIQVSHLYRVTNTRCRIGTVFSPDDGYIVARNMKWKATNILRKYVHQFGSIYKKVFCASPKCPDRFWGPHSLLSRCYWIVCMAILQSWPDVDHSSPSIDGVRNEWSHTCISLCLNGLCRKNCNFTYILCFV